MAVGLSIQVVGLEPLKGKLSPALYTEAVARLISGLALTAERAARENAPKDTSALARSIVSDIHPMMARVYSPLGYAAAMDQGRRPGARPPPPDALRGWAQRHGFRGSLFVLARAIGRRGIKGKHFFLAAKVAVEAAMPSLVADAANQIRAKWAE